jgi:response regulator RpfG family c-di-GMP phosphodiesterase
MESIYMSETVLFVDDEEQVLHSIGGLFSKTDVTVRSTVSAREALDIVHKEPVSVVVSDHQMPEMMGIDLFSKIRDISPDTLKILLTSPADLAVAVDAINNGEIFRFVMKPWDNKSFIRTVEEAVARYQIIQSIKDGDETTLLSVAQSVELKDPYTNGHAERVSYYATMLAELFNMSEETKQGIKLGSYIHDCGKVGVPERILNKKSMLNNDEYETVKNHPRWGTELAIQAALPEQIINIIHYHHERFDGSGYPSGLQGDDIPMEAQIVAIADVYDALTSDRCYRTRFSDEKAIEIMLLMKGNVFNPDIIDKFVHDCLHYKKK